jgi:hypothetical protein
MLRLAAARALTGANSAVIFATGSSSARRWRQMSACRTAVDVCCPCRGHAADRCDLARLWTPYRLIIGTFAASHRPARRVRDPAFVVLAVLLRPSSAGSMARWRNYRFRGRWRQRSVSSQALSWVMAGGVFAGFRSATRAMDQGSAALSARLLVCDAGFNALVAMAVLSGAEAPRLIPRWPALFEIARQPRFVRRRCAA